MSKVMASAKKVVPVTAKTVAKEVDGADLKKGKRPAHPGIGKAGYPFETLPADYDFDRMHWLLKSDFTTTKAFFLYRAADCDHRAAKFRAMAEKAAMKGGKEAKRLAKMVAQIEILRKALSAQGIDVAALEEQAKATLAGQATE